MLKLTTRLSAKTVEIEEKVGHSILDLALKNKVEWGFSCTRGTCARCRCLITEGRELLEEPTDAEWDRLEPEEIEEGYRLGCQATIKKQGQIAAINKTYF